MTIGSDDEIIRNRKNIGPTAVTNDSHDPNVARFGVIRKEVELDPISFTLRTNSFEGFLRSKLGSNLFVDIAR